jgi:site-specific recombinase XerD
MRAAGIADDELRVREGKGKKERTIPLMPELKTALQRYVSDRAQ